MRTALCSLVFALFVFFAFQPAPVHAFSMNIERMTCTDLMNMDEETIGYILVWIDGYYTGKTGSTDFDPDSWENLGELIGTICEQNPRRRIIEAIDQVLRSIRGY